MNHSVKKMCIAALLGVGMLSGIGASAQKTIAKPLKTFKTEHGQQPVVLVKDGKAKVVIVVPEPINQHFFGKNQDMAVKALTEYIKSSTNVEIKVVKAKDYKGGKAIFLGNSPAAAKAGFEFNNLKPEHFRIMTKDGNLAIIGMDSDVIDIKGPNGALVKEQMQSHGTIFGVADFLERFVGVRWYYPGELGTIVPRHKDLIIPPCNYEDGPVYTRRHAWTRQLVKENREFAYIWRYGEGIGHGNHSHEGWADIFPGKPELFALKRDGTREMTYFGGQLDYTNPEVKELEIQRLKEFYKTGNRKLWKTRAPRNSYFYEFPCDCMSENYSPAFQEYLKSYKGDRPEIEQFSKLIHQFYADVAVEAEKLWPEKYMLFGAYSRYTLPAKDVKYHNNMIAEVCIMDGMAFHKEPAKYKFWLDVLRQYTELTGNKPYFWHYPTWPMESTNAPLIFPHLVNRWHRDAKDISQGAFLCGLMRSWEQDHLNAYIWMKSMWNPDFDVQAALDEYYTLCYGAAAPIMKEYFDLLIDRWENTIWNVPCGKPGGLPMNELYRKTYPPEIREKLKKFEQKALAFVPENSKEFKRIKLVVDANKDFYKGAELFERIGRGSVLYVSQGTPQNLDGKLDGLCWKAVGMQMRDRASGRDVDLKSVVKMCYDNKNLYIACEFAEPNVDKIRAKSKNHDEAVWDDDGIEIFISPQHYPEHYAQLVINTEGIMFDGWKEVDATFNKYKDFKIKSVTGKGENGFTMEVAIPWAELGIKAPEPGTSMRANVIRNRTTGETREIFAMSPTLKQSNHDTTYFGTLIFTGNDRLFDDFSGNTNVKWGANAIGGKGDPEARAELIKKDTYSTFEAKMSKKHHVSNLSCHPGIWLNKGDLIEVRYRGPHADIYGRLELSFKLQAEGEAAKSSWKADNTKNKDEWKIFVVDPFERCKIDAPRAKLLYLSVNLASKKGEQNSMDIDYIRISPHTTANVD
jgi:hypothetical protein